MNFNTIMMAVLIGLGGWTLSTSLQQGKTIAVLIEKVDALTKSGEKFDSGLMNRYTSSDAIRDWSQQFQFNNEVRQRLRDLERFHGPMKKDR